MSPDTQQNIIYALILLVLHNSTAIIYAFGLVMSIFVGLIKPSRARILFMVGFALLLLAFEYGKHIQEPLLEQTKQSLITERYSARIENVITLGIGRAAPLGLQVIGVSCISLGVLMGLRNILRSVINKKPHKVKPVGIH